MKTTFLAFLFLLFHIDTVYADTVVLDQSLSTMPFSTLVNFQINSTEETEAADFEILIQNGDGLDYFPQPCTTGNMGQRMQCKAHNLLIAARVALDRPSDLEIKLNGSVIISRNSFPKEKGQFVYHARLSGLQTLDVYQAGLPMTSTTVKVVKYGDGNASPIAGFSYSSVNGFVEPSTVSFSGLSSVDPDGTIVDYNWNFGDGSFGQGSMVNHIYESAGQYLVTLTVTDNRGAQASRSENIFIQADSIPPFLTNIQPPSGSAVTGNSVVITGDSNESLSKVEIQVDGEPVLLAEIDPEDSFKFLSSISFVNGGTKTILIRAYDFKNNFSEFTVNYNLNFNNPPEARINLLGQNSEVAPSMIWLDASSSTDADNESLTFEWNFDDGSDLSNEAKPTHFFKEPGNYNVTLKVTDARGLSSETSKSITLGQVALPIDPALIATPLEENIYQSGADKYEFLYKDPQGPQKNVDQTKMVEKLVTPLRGRVLKDENDPLSAVKVAIVGHPEYGFTYTREDGLWDLAVNGGDDIEVLFEKTGYSKAIRVLDTERLVAPVMDDIVLTELDQKSTEISFNSEAPQLHEATVVQDESGVRKTQVLIPENTTAQLKMPDGSLRSVDKLTIRATEVTVGALGPKRMPAALPPRSAYTYCASFTADEALALGAESIEFSQPVPVYLDNYLGLPIGVAVPAGYFNPQTASWETLNDGVVVKILGVTQDLKAQLDMNGSNSIADAATLSAWGVTDSELTLLAQKYQVGQSFWRVRLKHFSDVDLNLAAGQIIANKDSHPPPQAGVNPATGPGAGSSNDGIVGACSDREPDKAKATGCEIDPRQQTMAEYISLPGIDFNLHYTSARAPGYKASSAIRGGVFKSLEIAGRPILRGEVVIDIAGKKTTYSYNQPDLTQSFEYFWDGRDVNNQLITSSAEATVTITYYVRNIYMLYGASSTGLSFNMVELGITGTPFEGRGEYALSRSFKINVKSPAGTTNSRLFHGWSAGLYHSYDVDSQSLYLGDGGFFKAKKFIPVVTNVAGNGVYSSAGDSGNANAASLMSPTDITTDKYGNTYIADLDAGEIRKIDANGLISRIAGNNQAATIEEGDNGPAVDAKIGKPSAIRVQDENIYFIDSENYLVRKINKDGIISIFAGFKGSGGASGDGAPANQTILEDPSSLAIAKDGSIYIAEKGSNRIRRIDTNGIIKTVLTSDRLGSMAIDKNDNVYFTSGWRVYIFEGNSARIVAGYNGPGYGPYEEYKSALLLPIEPSALAVDIEGQIYFYDKLDQSIKTVNRDQQMVTVAGPPMQPGFNGNNGLARDTKFFNPKGLWIDSGGNILVADSGNHRVRKIGNRLPTYFPAVIASVDGSEVYYFNSIGQHFQTKRADTGALKYNFVHDTAGNLVQITDAYSKTTTLYRNAGGELTSIVGPYGQTFQIGMRNGMIGSVTDPLNHATLIEYTSDTSGLVSKFTKPNGNAATYEYDSIGRLVKITEPNQGIRTLVYNPVTNAVTFYKGENAQGIYRVHSDSRDNLVAVTSMSISGQYNYVEKTQELRKGVSTLKIPLNFNTDITTQTFSQSDPRFAGQAGYVSRQITTYPNLVWPNSGVYDVSHNRSYSTNPDGINFIKTETTTDNAGYSETTSFNSQTRTIASVTSLGKSTNILIDEHEKPLRIQVGNQIAPVEYSYDDHGRLKNIAQGNRITVLNYDPNGFLAEVVDPENRSTVFTNDALGKVLKTRTPDSEETLFSYDGNANLTGITPPQRTIYQFVINAIDLVGSFIAPGAPGKTFNYNSDGLLVSILSENQRQTQMKYAGGDVRPYSIMSDDLAVFPRYANGGHLSLSEIWGGGLSVAGQSTPGYQIVNERTWYGDLQLAYSDGRTATRTYTYNLTGLMPASENFYYGDINYTFNADKLLTQVGDLVVTRDNSTGLVTQKTLGNIAEAIIYSQYGEVASREYKVSGNTIYKEQYTRDKLGRITNKRVTKNSNIKDLGYEYDLKGRLKKTFENQVLKNSYSYDAQGNRVSKNDDYTAIYDGRDRITSYTKENVQTAYTYSDDGTNVVKAKPGEITTYTVSLLGPLMQVYVQSGDSFAFNYILDGEMQRIYKEFAFGGRAVSKFSFDKNGRIIGERRLAIGADYTSRFIYGTQDHSPDYMLSNFTGQVKKYFFIKDQIGSILAVVDENGVTVQEIQYDEFGQILSDTNPGLQAFGFAGGIYDRDTGLTKFGARDYNAETGRWLERDPILFKGGDTNLYSYCGNDPINCVDPEGKDIPDLIDTWKRLKKDMSNWKRFLRNYRKAMMCKIDPKYCDPGHDPDNPFPDDDNIPVDDPNKDKEDKEGASCPIGQ